MPSKDHSDSLRLLVAGSSFSDWSEANLDSDIFTPADAWNVKSYSPGKELVGFFREGARVEMYIGADRQLAGVIDEVHLSGDPQKESLTISGRDLGAFILDCEAKKIRASKYTLGTLIKKLLDPTWGIRNVLTNYDKDRKLALGKKDKGSKAATGRRSGGSLFSDTPRTATTIDPGQRVSQILEQRTSQLGCTWWLTAGGDFFLGKPQYEQEPAYRFVCWAPSNTTARRRENNVESWSVVRSMSDRYSEITVAAQGAGASGFLAQPSSVKGAKFIARAQDPDLVARGINRTMIIADSDCLTPADAQRRADSEMGHRRLSGLTIELTVPDFRQGDRLYAIDTIADVQLETANVAGHFYVTARRFSETRHGRRTHLTLHQPKVWLG